jgi:hypothetical protein
VLSSTVVTEEAREQGRGIAEMSTRAAWFAWALCTLTVALVACAVAFTVLTRTGPRDFTFLLGVLSSAIVGTLVTSRRPENPIGWFFALARPALRSLKPRSAAPSTD